jgi:hypothetical protein
MMNEENATKGGGRVIVTEDKVSLQSGDRAFNYYDMRPGVIGKISDRAQPDTMKGQNSSTPIEEWSNYWFDFQHDDGTSALLDGSRICSTRYAKNRGWL